MDHYLNHHQWLPRPVQPNVCPVCSTQHFPFCPQPPPYHPYQSPNFPPHHNFPRPGFNPYPGPPAPGYHYPYAGDGGYGDPRPWGMHLSHQHDYQAAGGAVAEADWSYKRHRLDEISGNPLPGAVENENHGNPTENERRLKLIHDHGAANSAASSPQMYNFEEPVVAGSGDRKKRPRFEQGNQFELINRRNGFQFSSNYSVVVMGNNHFINGPMTPPPPPTQLPYGAPPPLPLSPPPSFPVARPMPSPSHFPVQPSPLKTSFFPVSTSSSVMPPHSVYPPRSGSPYNHVTPISDAPTGFIRETSIQLKSPDKPKVIDASRIFKLPHRATRPDHFVIILRGLPGSGKSYLAKMLRDIEVENGGNAPRIHSMDDYFMTEVEKLEQEDAPSSARNRKPVTKKVMEYCYEPEMEETYRSSMLKAFKRTLDAGNFTFVIVDDRNLRVADFAQFWATAKRSGFEVYILEATYKDPAGCAARNVHGFSLEEIEKMAERWEEAPSLYMQLDIKSLSHGDDLKASEIQEVDMDMEDDNLSQERKSEKSAGSTSAESLPEDSSEGQTRLVYEENHSTEVKELSRSKWSNLEDDEQETSEGLKQNTNTIFAGSTQPGRKEGKSVRWGDQGGDVGFSIGAKGNMPSLIIGPGAGYNLKSNPLTDEERQTYADSIGKAKLRSVFQEQLRAEHESFKAVFDRRRQQNGRIDLEDD